MGVRDISEVSGRTWRIGHSSGRHDGRRARSKYDVGMVCRHSVVELDALREPSRNAISISNGSYCKYVARHLHEKSAGGPDGIRVDRVRIRTSLRCLLGLGGRGTRRVVPMADSLGHVWSGIASVYVMVHGSSLGLVTHTGQAREG